MRIEASGHFPDEEVDKKFADLIDRLNGIRSLRIGFLVTGGLFSLAAIVLGVLFWRMRKKNAGNAAPERPLNDSVSDEL